MKGGRHEKALTEAFIARVRPPKTGTSKPLTWVIPASHFALVMVVPNHSVCTTAPAPSCARRSWAGGQTSVSAAARDQWRSTREAAAKGEVPQAKPNGLLFETVVEEWLKRDMSQRNTASSLRQVTRMVDGDLLPAWRGRQIGAITKKDVIALLDAVVDRGAKVKANRLHACHVAASLSGASAAKYSPPVL